MTSGSLAGAEMRTFLAPASRCFWAPARSVKNPVDSSTTSTPRSPHGRLAGSRSENIFISSPPALMTPSPSSTSPAKGPRTESYFRRCAMVFASPRSFSATISTSAPSCCCARKKLRPIRPKPLIPTRVAMLLSPPCARVAFTASLVRWWSWPTGEGWAEGGAPRTSPPPRARSGTRRGWGLNPRPGARAHRGGVWGSRAPFSTRCARRVSPRFGVLDEPREPAGHGRLRHRRIGAPGELPK